jgi:thioredoxin-related protein
MYKKIILLSLLFVFFSASVLSQTTETKTLNKLKSNSDKLVAPKPAKPILNAALKEAKSSGKTVFLIFHATWCSWCHRLDKVMESPELKILFSNNFVVTHLDVLEQKEKIKTFENAGGKEMMEKFGGAQSGLPFYVFLDSKGNKIADSNVMPKNGNIGYPGSGDEIAAFAGLLKKSSKKITDEQIKTITEYLTKNAPK